MSKFALAIHGGAGTILRNAMSAEKEEAYTQALQTALLTGYNLLAKGASALDAVEAVVCAMEDDPLFNAGKGSVYNHAGGHEMDAAIMNGADLRAGAVALLSHVKNPVSLARAVMEKSEHVFLCGAGAEQFAREVGLPLVAANYFDDPFRYRQFVKIKDHNTSALDNDVQLPDEKKFGTVGAVALDTAGNLAAATSTGGMTNKKFGRIGDSSIIGAGTYANNNTCAVSCTGHGELFIRGVVAYDVSCLMEYKGLSLKQACAEVVYQKLPAIQGAGGLIAIDKQGNIELCFNSEGMYRAMKHSDGRQFIGIYQ